MECQVFGLVTFLLTLNKINISYSKPFLFNPGEAISSLLGASSSASSASSFQSEDVHHVADYTKKRNGNLENNDGAIDDIDVGTTENPSVVKKKIELVLKHVRDSFNAHNDQKQNMQSLDNGDELDQLHNFDDDVELIDSQQSGLKFSPSTIGYFIAEVIGSLVGITLGAVGQISMNFSTQNNVSTEGYVY